ncbi:MAG: SagB/ThcOx family dehydrogenase [Gammaproteobacteria bacterium]|nr:SagB/ThcOx family dehydrogenase [Gammaproteobacteria bacterium]MBU1415471.1 SagB/ThcOx family dehydrogenase [Gammaproteobacteria bacterium]
MELVRIYHERSKHRQDRYAPGPGGLDWATQPNPFRRYAGAPELELPLLAGELPVCWDDLFGPGVPQQAMTVDSIASFLQLSLGLSAWKSYGGNRWALRCNPSSGNLHPTEGYLICPALPGLPAGVHHYRPDQHGLEQRAVAPFAWSGGVLLALTGIHWREAWKYGMRAFRYCQHDCGHALAALSYAAAALGWPARLLADWGDDEIAALTGLARAADFAGAESKEAEEPEALVWIGPGIAPTAAAVLATLNDAEWAGHANTLSPQHRDWPDIPAVAAATRKSAGTKVVPAQLAALPPLSPASQEPVSHLIRRRRSAQAFDGVSAITAASFYRMLDALLPRIALPPWSLTDEAPYVHPVLFVHRVDGIEPGIYCLPRTPAALAELRASMRPDWLWASVPGCPAHLPLYLLAPMDVRDFAAAVSCQQDIAADSAFAIAMLARFDDIDPAHAWRYRQRYWEAGMLGQVLYLEAEAAGVQGTGIGCYFDDALHRALGLDTARFQDLYHFTVGKAVVDKRLGSDAPYDR